jgi:glycosyltransferase involved in cell wall biosynthesis
MSDPRFSIVVPSRERADTLHYTLLSLLDQDFEDYEVVVHDNCSSAATREVVEGFRSAKLKYFRSDKPLAMRDSWERALSFAKGEYVTVIGDDDALLSRALCIVDNLLRSMSLSIIRWTRASYRWPNHLYAEKRNSLKIPLGNSGYFLPGRTMMKKVVNERLPFATLPMLYNSMVHRDLIAAIRQKCGRVFFSPSPDLGSGYALAYVAGRYLSIETPMTIGGASGKGNGLASDVAIHSGAASDVAKDFANLNAKAGIAVHARLPAINLWPVAVADPFYHVKDALFPNDPMEANRKELILRCVEQLKWSPAEVRKDAMKLMRESLRDTSRLQAWFDRKVARKGLPAPEKVRIPNTVKGFLEREKIIGLDACDFGVTDVYGAVKLCEKILNYNRGGFRCNIKEYFASPYSQFRSIGRILLRRDVPTLPDCD